MQRAATADDRHSHANRCDEDNRESRSHRRGVPL
jgi:hypothetical protein